MTLLYPKLLWLAVVIPLLIAYYIWVGRRSATLSVSTLGKRRMPRTLRYWLRPLPITLRIAAIALLIIAIARPIESEHNRKVSVNGIDIVLAVDISGSMLARDFKPNRIEAAKQIASTFIADREADRFSLVAFAGEAYTLTPITADRGEVQTLMASLRNGVIDDGTAIGNGLATALNRLRDSEAKSKVVVLLTDGVNNAGQITPMMSAEIARDMGVKVYTIGVGSKDKAPYPAKDIFGNEVEVLVDVEIDEEQLTAIADMTGGQYFRATDEEALKSIYDKINEMEKSEVQVIDTYHNKELYGTWLLLGLLLLLVEFIVARIVLNRIP
jgi:Ca-activated chloride channel family protein